MSEVSPENEVYTAYEQLLRKIKDTQKITRQEEKIIEEKKQIVEMVVKETDESIAKHFSSLKVSICKTLDDMEEKLLLEQKKIAMQEQAKEVLKKELFELYQIKADADSLAILFLAHKEKTSELEEDMAKKRNLWKREQEEHDLLRKERDARLQKERQREEEEYVYQRDMARKKWLDDYEANKRKQELDLSLRRSQLEDEYKKREDEFLTRERDFHAQYEMTKRDLEQEISAKQAKIEEEIKLREENLLNREKEFKERYDATTRDFEEKYSAREAVISAREEEFAKLQEEVNHFPKTLQNAIAETEKAITEKLKTDYDYQTKLAQAEFDGERKLHHQEVETLKARIEHLASLNYSFSPMAFNKVSVDGDNK